MNRRNLLKSIAGLTGLGLLSSSAKAKDMVKIQSSFIAGIQYYQAEQVWKRLDQGEVLVLKREPKNQYDKQAIEVYWRDQKLGYLPRTQNYTINQMLQNQWSFKVVLERKELDKTGWKKLVISIYRA